MSCDGASGAAPYSTAAGGRDLCVVTSFITSRSSSCKHTHTRWGGGVSGDANVRPAARRALATHQQSQEVRRHQHVEDLIPAPGRQESGQQGAQRCTCAHQRSSPARRRDAGGHVTRRWSCDPPALTDRAGAVDDGGDRGQGSGVPLQALVGPLRRGGGGGVSGGSELVR